MLRLVVVSFAMVVASAAIALTTAMKSFGHSIKDAKIVSNEEVTVFEHTCSSPPCTVTQMHCPTVGPHGWYDAVLRIFIDDEPSLNLTMLELANIGNPAGSPTGAEDFGNGDNGPWGNALFGHTAHKGGVYSTVRIPFGEKLKVTITASNNAGQARLFFIIRGVESYPVVLGDLILPTAARLRLHRFENLTQPAQLVTLADVPSGTAGALLGVRFDANGSKGFGFLEACMRAMVDGAARPLYLSSGAEDYFLSGR
jgi:hypothetical protein